MRRSQSGIGAGRIAKLRGRFECPRSEAESRREDAGTVPVA